MGIYLVLLILCVFGCIWASHDTDKQRFIAGVMSMIMLFLCGLRGTTVGTDTHNYLEVFRSSAHIGRSAEFLFVLTYKLIPFPHLWLFFTSCLIYIPLWKVIKKATPYPAVAILIYMISTTKFFPESFNIIRQAIAASFILACFVDWGAERYKRSLLFLIIAVMFHNSSIIVLPFLLLKNIKIRPIIVWIGVSVTFFVGLSQVFQDIVSLLILGLETVSGDGTLNETLSVYATYGSNGTTFNINYILGNTLPLSMMCLLTLPPRHTARKQDHFYFNILYVTTLIANIIIASTQYGFRVVFSLYIIQILVVANAFCYKNKIGRQILTVFLIFLGLLYIYYLYGLSQKTAGNIHTIIPYQFFFQ